VGCVGLTSAPSHLYTRPMTAMPGTEARRTFPGHIATTTVLTAIEGWRQVWIRWILMHQDQWHCLGSAIDPFVLDPATKRDDHNAELLEATSSILLSFPRYIIRVDMLFALHWTLYNNRWTFRDHYTPYLPYSFALLVLLVDHRLLSITHMDY